LPVARARLRSMLPASPPPPVNLSRRRIPSPMWQVDRSAALPARPMPRPPFAPPQRPHPMVVLARKADRRRVAKGARPKHSNPRVPQLRHARPCARSSMRARPISMPV
jgi:hypothetical protein